MDRFRRQLESRVPQPVIALMATALIVIGVTSPILFAIIIVGLILPAVAILEVVRWINDRDDPRRQKLPPDAP